MDGQQVFVTGADGEQMVLSGPEAAALLAQAGISLGDQDQAGQTGAGELSCQYSIVYVCISRTSECKSQGTVFIVNDIPEETGEQPVTQEQSDNAVAPGPEEGNILVPPGSSVAEDGSILAADGTILAPAGTVSIGPDGTLMMSENSALLSDTAPGPAPSTGEQVFTTPDGLTIKAGEGDILTDADGNFLTDEAGNILTTAHLSALGAVASGTGETLTSSAPSLNSGDTPIISADGLQSDGHFLRTADGNLLTDEEGNFITPDGNVIKPEEAHKILASQEAAAELVNVGDASSGEVLQSAAGEILQNVGEEVLQDAPSEILQNAAGDVGQSATPAVSNAEEKRESESMIISKPVNETDVSMDEPPQLEVRRSSVDLPTMQPVESTEENNAIEPEKSKSETGPLNASQVETTEDIAPAVPEAEPVPPESQEAGSLSTIPFLVTEEEEGNMKTSDGPSANQTSLPVADPSVSKTAETDAVPSSKPLAEISAEPDTETSPESADILSVATQQAAAELAVSQALSSAEVLATATAEIDSTVAATLSNSEQVELPVASSVKGSSAEVAVSIPSLASVTATLPVELSLPTSSDGGIYTTADGQVLSLPEGIVTNQSGHLINPADGSILTTEDGTPLVLPEGAILQSAPEGSVVASDIGLSTTSGGIMVSSGQTQSDILSTVTSSIAAPVPVSVPVSSVQLTQSPDGTMIAPEGSMIASDGSILAADGTMLAPPGSVSLTPEPPTMAQIQLPTQPTNPPIPASLAPTEPLPSQPQNLIGLQLPESGEVLYLDPNDPAAQQLLQEAGISLGDNGVLQTLDGQVLQGEDGNPITANSSKPPAAVTSFASSPTKHNNIVTGALAAAGLVDTSDIDIPLSHGVVTDIRPNLPSQPVSYNQLTAGNDDAIRQHLSQLQPRYTPPAKQTKAQQKTQYKKLTFNSGAAGPSYASPAPASIPKRSIAPKQRRTVPNTDLQIGPDQQKVCS